MKAAVEEVDALGAGVGLTRPFSGSARLAFLVLVPSAVTSAGFLRWMNGDQLGAPCAGTRDTKTHFLILLSTLFRCHCRHQAFSLPRQTSGSI